jgi:hypothetical protein
MGSMGSIRRSWIHASASSSDRLFLQSGELLIATPDQRRVVPNRRNNYTAYTDGAYTYQNKGISSSSLSTSRGTQTVKGHRATFRDDWKAKGTLNFREIVDKDTMSTQMPKIHYFDEIPLASDSHLYIMLVSGRSISRSTWGQLYGKIIYKAHTKSYKLDHSGHVFPISWEEESGGTKHYGGRSRVWYLRQGSSSATRECSSSPWRTNISPLVHVPLNE